MTSRALRILHCPHNVGANPQGLARAEREIGLDSWAVALEAHPFGYPIDEVLWGGSLGVAGRELSRIKLFARALRGFDVIHFNFGQSCTPSLISFDRPSLSRRLSIPWRVALPLVRWGIGLIELRDLPILR
ncbi:hypothetical protein IH601_04780, partial [Candidatus Bipolaricaulota bacterium]|nr:hypothetical protein [Candidatus Bipolaricaulota bacterium]